MIATGTGWVGSTAFKVSSLLNCIRAWTHSKERVDAVLELGALQWDQVWDAGRDCEALGCQAAGAAQDSRAVEDVERDGDHAAILGLLEERAVNPLVEC